MLGLEKYTINVVYPASPLSYKTLTEVNFSTYGTINDTEHFVKYLRHYDPTFDMTEHETLKKRDENDKNAKAFWKGYSPIQIQEKLDEVFLSCDKTHVMNVKDIKLKYPMTKEIIDVGIQILRDVYNVFYVPTPITTSQLGIS